MTHRDSSKRCNRFPAIVLVLFFQLQMKEPLSELLPPLSPEAVLPSLPPERSGPQHRLRCPGRHWKKQRLHLLHTPESESGAAHMTPWGARISWGQGGRRWDLTGGRALCRICSVGKYCKITQEFTDVEPTWARSSSKSVHALKITTADVLNTTKTKLQTWHRRKTALKE